MTNSTCVRTEALQTARVQHPTAADTPAKRDPRVQMVVTEYGLRFVEPDSADRSPILLGLASFGSCLAHVKQTVLAATTRLLTAASASREPREASGAGSAKTPTGQDRPRTRWSCLRRRPNLDKVGR